ncbi:hypothetical protein BC940DRAFT_323662 [Gongronella butleri]|nr:hypothetical protein BC940DRAFT_323662 [Gongronella butleri]
MSSGSNGQAKKYPCHCKFQGCRGKRVLRSTFLEHRREDEQETDYRRLKSTMHQASGSSQGDEHSPAVVQEVQQSSSAPELAMDQVIGQRGAEIQASVEVMEVTEEDQVSLTRNEDYDDVRAAAIHPLVQQQALVLLYTTLHGHTYTTEKGEKCILQFMQQAFLTISLDLKLPKIPLTAHKYIGFNSIRQTMCKALLYCTICEFWHDRDIQQGDSSTWDKVDGLCKLCNQKSLYHDGTVRPKHMFYYQPLKPILQQMMLRPGFKAKINKWRKSYPPKNGRISDIMHGARWHEILDAEGKPLADDELHATCKVRALEWKAASTESAKNELYKKNGVRWSELYRLPYIQLTRDQPPDPMHNIGCGTARAMLVRWLEDGTIHKKELPKIVEMAAKIQLPPGFSPCHKDLETPLALTADQLLTWVVCYSPIVMAKQNYNVKTEETNQQMFFERTSVNKYVEKMFLGDYIRSFQKKNQIPTENPLFQFICSQFAPETLADESNLDDDEAFDFDDIDGVLFEAEAATGQGPLPASMTAPFDKKKRKVLTDRHFDALVDYYVRLYDEMDKEAVIGAMDRKAVQVDKVAVLGHTYKVGTVAKVWYEEDDGRGNFNRDVYYYGPIEAIVCHDFDNKRHYLVIIDFYKPMANQMARMREPLADGVELWKKNVVTAYLAKESVVPLVRLYAPVAVFDRDQSTVLVNPVPRRVILQ